MSTLAALLMRARLPRNDYMRLALVVSVAIHALVLSLHFTGGKPPPPSSNTLEVMLVNTSSQTAPITPQALAQQQLDGGGNERAGQSSSPLPYTAAETPDQLVLAALRKRQEQLESEQTRLYTQLIANEQVQAERKLPDLFEQSTETGTDARHQESQIINAQISALKERIDHYNAQPRQRFVGPSALAAEDALYVESWRQKIEQLGTEHYPEQARGKVYGSLQLTVYIRRDGSLDHIEIDQPSPHAVLNLAARRIVQLAAPFAPLPPAIAKDTDMLAITRTWHFMNQQLLTETP
ncbi:MAG: TonB family protein [Burkholderiaceae bacterium]|nr:TonB family protein [Burkholderiaceae bacterium]